MMVVTADNTTVNHTTMWELILWIHLQTTLAAMESAGVHAVLVCEDHVPCLAHVINIILQELLHHMKLEALNDSIDIFWDK